MKFLLILFACLGFTAAQAREVPAVCATLKIDPKASQALSQQGTRPALCVAHLVNGFPVPDRQCTPGAVDPTVSKPVLEADGFTTKCIRDLASTAAQKAHTYDWYGIKHPANNTGKTQTCELDHLVSLELGGADTLDNIWPQCGPDGATLNERYFKQKDSVENYLAAEVKAGRMDLAEAQRGIATNWTQYLAAAHAAGH